jgi:hypothetical protein
VSTLARDESAGRRREPWQMLGKHPLSAPSRGVR